MSVFGKKDENITDIPLESKNKIPVQSKDNSDSSNRKKNTNTLINITTESETNKGIITSI